ncbi:hypothetical protein WK73_04495 [Burkholderia ubonensis]|nr:hypothetical protein WK73_04495 [Burkholderia ubonensis]
MLIVNGIFGRAISIDIAVRHTNLVIDWTGLASPGVEWILSSRRVHALRLLFAYRAMAQAKKKSRAPE